MVLSSNSYQVPGVRQAVSYDTRKVQRTHKKDGCTVSPHAMIRVHCACQDGNNIWYTAVHIYFEVYAPVIDLSPSDVPDPALPLEAP